MSAPADSFDASSDLCGQGRGAYKPWSKEEDEKLRVLVETHNANNWPDIANQLPGRTSKSCRLRWVNQLRGDLVAGPFSPEEDDKIVQLQAVHGNKWSAIARELPGRTDNMIKNRWNSYLRKRLESGMAIAASMAAVMAANPALGGHPGASAVAPVLAGLSPEQQMQLHLAVLQPQMQAVLQLQQQHLQQQMQTQQTQMQSPPPQPQQQVPESAASSQQEQLSADVLPEAAADLAVSSANAADLASPGPVDMDLSWHWQPHTMGHGMPSPAPAEMDLSWHWQPPTDAFGPPTPFGSLTPDPAGSAGLPPGNQVMTAPETQQLSASQLQQLFHQRLAVDYVKKQQEAQQQMRQHIAQQNGAANQAGSGLTTPPLTTSSQPYSQMCPMDVQEDFNQQFKNSTNTMVPTPATDGAQSTFFTAIKADPGYPVSQPSSVLEALQPVQQPATAASALALETKAGMPRSLSAIWKWATEALDAAQEGRLVLPPEEQLKEQQRSLQGLSICSDMKSVLDPELLSQGLGMNFLLRENGVFAGKEAPIKKGKRSRRH